MVINEVEKIVWDWSVQIFKFFVVKFEFLQLMKYLLMFLSRLDLCFQGVIVGIVKDYLDKVKKWRQLIFVDVCNYLVKKDEEDFDLVSCFGIREEGS